MSEWYASVGTECYACKERVSAKEMSDDPDKSYKSALAQVGDGISNIDGGWLRLSPGTVVVLCKKCYEKGKKGLQDAILVKEEDDPCQP